MEQIYKPTELDDIIKKINLPIRRWCNKEYYNIACSFDIETSSFYNNGNKQSIMYVWQFDIDGCVVVGRTWSEFVEFINNISQRLLLHPDRRILVCYVHNLAYEFQFIRKLITWKDVFCVDTRKPVKALASCGILFKCSYILSGASLDTVANNLQYESIKKLIGNLDYEQVRTPKTPLTKNELKYCINDVKIVVAYIREQIQQCGSICRIPLTKTGFVRRYIKNAVLYNNETSHKSNIAKQYNKTARKLFKNLTLQELEYQMLIQAFCGGFTHANPLISGLTLNNVTSYDFTSSYPTVMLSEQFPMSQGKQVVIESKNKLEYYINNYCCLFTITLYNVQSNINFEHYISESKCLDIEDAVVDNGRVVSASKLCIVTTDVDYETIKKVYTWSHMQISKNSYIYDRGYLPKQLCESILKLYVNKTQLKDVDGKETEYQISKAMLNSCYGMIVTSIIKETLKYNNELGWVSDASDINEALDKYNKSTGRFLFYPWGVWITAYARRNLWSGILACGNDYCYADTDSVKILNADKHQDYFNNYNNLITTKIKNCLEYHNIDISQATPSTIEGIKKPLGVWDYDGFYDKFKTLGAKRYMIENNGKLKITVAGVSKKLAVKYIEQQPKPFEFFSDGMLIPSQYTGKLTHTYLDEPMHGIVTDYLGQEYEYDESSGIHLEPQDYSMSLSEDYADYLLRIAL